MKLSLLYAYAVVVSVLLLADISWQSWQHLHKKEAPPPQPFSFLKLHTNGATGLGIIDSKTKEPIWTKLYFSPEGSESITYYFQGKSIMDVHLRPGKSPRRDVVFYDANGDMKSMWGDRSGLGTFTDRVLYGQGTQMEVWYDDSWQPVVERDGLRGIVLDGTWQRLTFTNNAWTTVP